jgi:distribution and morphology protein 31
MIFSIATRGILHHHNASVSVLVTAARNVSTSSCIDSAASLILRKNHFSTQSQLQTQTRRLGTTSATSQHFLHSQTSGPATPFLGTTSSARPRDSGKYYGSCPLAIATRPTGIEFAPVNQFHTCGIRWKSTSRETRAVGAEKVSPPLNETGASGSKPLYERLPEAAQHVAGRFHRPTKEELLAAASGFWARLRVRFKWATIRSARPFNIDELGAFFSWILLGHVIWIILGTTTFVSLLILAVNTVFAQETLARWVGNSLTKSSGIKVVFESAIVPRWKDGVITFKNVFVSRRPGQHTGEVSKGSQLSAAAAAAAAAELASARRNTGDVENEDTNYTQFDVSIETINVTLSFSKWFNGKGLLRDVEIKGVRGVVDRTHVFYSGEYIDPRTYKHVHEPGDFEIESFKLEDLLVSVYQPRNFRPYSVSIFTADLPQLRKQWLFYDWLSANHVSGSFDDSLFTIHPRQIHNLTGAQLSETVSEQEHRHWKKHSRIRLDGLKIDHLNRGVDGPFSWIHEGNVDIVADIAFPAEDDDTIVQLMSDFYERMEQNLTSSRYLKTLAGSGSGSGSGTSLSNTNTATTHDAGTTLTPAPESSTAEAQSKHTKDNHFLILDLSVHLNAVHAFVPLFTHDLSYVNNALVRPIVAYINANKDCIPVSCRVVKRLSEFDGSWTIFDSGMMEDMSRETYEAFARDIEDSRAVYRRMKKVGLWSLQLAVQALFLGLAGHLA